ncbi:hypothetical protein EKK58_04635 [Candidatus Dependentiae bacterium]|nr:MAG: hypothetical protein EKK58_04635 [Candidatus Dependentiae bacterium]
MKKIIVLISFFINSVLLSREMHVIPYAYYAGQYYCLFLKGPDKKIVSIKDSIKKGDDMVERAAKIGSLQTKALWGKYQKDDMQYYKRRPSKKDYYDSVQLFQEKITEAVGKELVMKTEKDILLFFEVPYIQSDWIQKAPNLAEAIDSWYAQHQLIWVKMQILFEQKGDSWAVRKRLTGLHGDLDLELKNILNKFGMYKFDNLSPLIKTQSALVKVVKHSTAKTRKDAGFIQSPVYSSASSSRLRRLRRSNR